MAWCLHLSLSTRFVFSFSPPPSRVHAKHHHRLRQQQLQFGDRNRQRLSAQAQDDVTFQSLGLTDEMFDITKRMDWNVPTAVQRLSIPAVLEMEHGNSASSLWCEGPTGSGKVSDGNEKRYHRLAPTHHRSTRRLAALRFRYCKYLSMEGNGITAVTVRDK